MENANSSSNLDHLLKIENKASGLVNDAQEEADRRVRDNEEKNRLAYEERYKVETKMQEASLKKNYDQVKLKYKETLNEYRNEISGVNVNTDRFCALLNGYLAVPPGREG